MILLLGIIAGTYLVLEGPKIFKPKAYEQSLSGPVNYLPAPSNLQVSCSSDNKTVTYSWSPVPEADKYHVRVNKQPFEVWNPEDKSSGDYSRLVYGNSNTSHYDVVSPNVDYKFSVQALPAGVEYSPQGNLSEWKLFNCGTPKSSAKRVFVTSTAYNGNLGGLSGADVKCQIRADAANLGGTWKTWLSDGNTNAKDRLTQNTTAYKTVNGQVIANNWSDLIDGSLITAVQYTENGEYKYTMVWTGTSPQGQKSTSSYGTYCKNWTSSDNDTTAPGGYIVSQNALTGTSNRTNQNWTFHDNPACGSQLPLYCFEQ